MPTIILEDGSIVENANSYIDLAFLSLYVSNRDLTIPSDDTEKEYLILKSMDYLESFSYKGSRVDASQELSWPREDVIVDSLVLDDESIPLQLKNAQAQLCVEINANSKIYPDPIRESNIGVVTEKTVGPLKKKYSFVPSVSSVKPIKFASVMIYLDKLLKSSNLKVVRA